MYTGSDRVDTTGIIDVRLHEYRIYRSRRPAPNHENAMVNRVRRQATDRIWLDLSVPAALYDPTIDSIRSLTGSFKKQLDGLYVGTETDTHIAYYSFYSICIEIAQ